MPDDDQQTPPPANDPPPQQEPDPLPVSQSDWYTRTPDERPEALERPDRKGK